MQHVESHIPKGLFVSKDKVAVCPFVCLTFATDCQVTGGGGDGDSTIFEREHTIFFPI